MIEQHDFSLTSDRILIEEKYFRFNKAGNPILQLATFVTIDKGRDHRVDRVKHRVILTRRYFLEDGFSHEIQKPLRVETRSMY